MSAEAPALVRSWPVGHRTATLTVPRLTTDGIRHAVIEWSPSSPGRLSAAELAQYQSGRTAALQELAQAAGIRIAVIDLVPAALAP